MIAARNHRVYLVLDPNEAIDLQAILLRSACLESIAAFDEDRKCDQRAQRVILRRLDAAIDRVREKGAKFKKLGEVDSRPHESTKK